MSASPWVGRRMQCPREGEVGEEFGKKKTPLFDTSVTTGRGFGDWERWGGGEKEFVLQGEGKSGSKKKPG